MEKYILKLYVSRGTANSERAIENLNWICKEQLDGQYEIEVIDVIKSPESAVNDKIIAVPTLVRQLPEPIQKIIGDLSNREEVLMGLDLISRSSKLAPDGGL